MKTKIFSFILLTALLISSCTTENPPPNPPPNPTNSNWKFKLTINGNTTHMEGSGYNPSSNYFYSGYDPSGGSLTSSFVLNDQSASSYISGDNCTGYILINPDLTLGVNPLGNCILTLALASPLADSILINTSWGYSLTFGGTMVLGSAGGANALRVPINIYVLGTTGSLNYTNFGNPVKGNYSGTIYTKSDILGGGSYDTPVTIDLDFVALSL